MPHSYVLHAEDDGEAEVTVVGCVTGEEEVDFNGGGVGYDCFGGEGQRCKGCLDDS